MTDASMPSRPPEPEQSGTRAHDGMDAETRAFLNQRARELNVTLPPVAKTPRHWWKAWRAPSGEPVAFPKRNIHFARAIFYHSRVPLIWDTVLAAVMSLAVAIIPYTMGAMLDAGLENGLTTALLEPALLFLLLLAVLMVCQGLEQFTEIGIWLNASIVPVRAISEQLSSNGRAIKKDRSAGEVVTAVTSDSDYVGQAGAWTPGLFGALITTVVAAYLMLQASVALGLVILIGLPLAFGLVAALVPPLQRLQNQAREEQGKLTTISTDAVAGLRILRGIGGEDVFNRHYHEQSSRVRDAQIKVALPAALMSMVRFGVPMIFTAGVVGYGAVLTFRGDITAGQLVSFFGYTSLMRFPISEAAGTANTYTRGWVGVKRMASIVRIDRQLTDPATPAPVPDLSTAVLSDQRSGATIRPGIMTALVCENPDVAAALAARLTRAGDQADGQLGGVRLGGRPLADFSVNDLRTHLYLSGAENHVFAGTLRDGVLGAAAHPHHSRGVTQLIAEETLENSTRQEHLLLRPTPSTPAEDQRVLEALRVADAHDVLDSLPGGLDGILEEQGRNLSGGQRQRVALARAIASHADVLVAVEPTSAVDSHTEARIAERLADFRRGLTTVVVSASPLVLDRCDDVIVLDASGRVIAEGTHAELRERAENGDPAGLAYHRIVTRQVGDDQ